MEEKKTEILQKKNDKFWKQESDSGYEIADSRSEIKIEDNEENTDKVLLKNAEENISAKPFIQLRSDMSKFDLILFVGNLDEEVSAVDVKLIFTRQSGILESDIIDVSMPWKVERNGKLCTFGFVELISEQAYQLALTLNHTVHNGKSVIILPSNRTHHGLFLMEKGEVIDKQEKVNPENEEVECEVIVECELEKGNKVEEKEIDDKYDLLEMREEHKNEDKVEERESKGTKSIIQVDETVKMETSKCTKSILQVDEIVETETSSNDNFIPVYKKSDHVAYLKHLPLDVSANEILQFLNFTQSDVVDICVLKNTRRKKANAKNQGTRAIIAFPSEEKLDICLAKNSKVLGKHIVEIQRHAMSKKVSSGEKRPFVSSTSSEAIEKSETPKKRILHVSSKEQLSNTDKLELDLFVKHVKWSATDQQIKDFFASVDAKVVGVKQLGDSQNKGRGMRFVTMEDKESLLKALALNGAILLGNRIKVNVRNDRTHLLSPLEGEVPPNYCTFIGNLPVKKCAEILKQSLTEYLKTIGCSVERMHIPLATNHSGNRGYAFVSFQDEKSLMKALALNSSSIQLFNCKVNVSVSNIWPENPKEAHNIVAKAKDQESRRSLNVEQENSRSGRQHKRKRRGPSSPHKGSIYKLQKDIPKKYVMEGRSTKDYYVKPPLQNSNQDLHGSGYNAYLDYLEFRDYVAMRKAYDEQQVFNDYQTHHQVEIEDGLMKQRDQSYLAHTTQSTYTTDIAKAHQESFPKPREEVVGSLFGNYATHLSSGCGDSIGYERQSLIPESFSSSYENLSQNPATTTHGYEKISQTSTTFSNCGYEKVPQVPTCISASVTRDVQDFRPIPCPSSTDVLSSSVWNTPCDTYNSNDKFSYKSTSPWISSDSQNYWKRHESESLNPRVVNSNDTISRRTQLPVCTANPPAETGSTLYTPYTSTPSSLHLTCTNPPGPCSDKSDVLFSRINRRISSYNVGTVQTTSCPSVAVETNWYPAVSSGDSQANEIYSYSNNTSAVNKFVEERRNNVVYEKSGTFVNKLLSSGILSSAGYNVSPAYNPNN